MAAVWPTPTQLDCPIPARMSPHADDTQSWLDGWLREDRLPLQEGALDRLTAAGFARYAARLYPAAEPADLRVLSALFTWFFLLDDACDGDGGGNPDRVRGLRAGVLRLLRDGPSARHSGFTGPLRRMLVETWQPVRRRMSSAWRSRFVDAVAHHLDGALTEAMNKAAGRPPTVAEYVELRRATSAAYVSYALTGFATDVVLPDAVYQHPLVRRISAVGNDLLSWFNDLVSLDRDVTGSGGHNLVLSVAREERLPIDAAVRAVQERWRLGMREFMELRAAVPAFGPAIDEPLAHYLDAVANSVRGTVDWSLESARYIRAGAGAGVAGRPAAGADVRDAAPAGPPGRAARR